MDNKITFHWLCVEKYINHKKVKEKRKQTDDETISLISIVWFVIPILHSGRVSTPIALCILQNKLHLSEGRHGIQNESQNPIFDDTEQLINNYRDKKLLMNKASNHDRCHFTLHHFATALGNNNSY